MLTKEEKCSRNKKKTEKSTIGRYEVKKDLKERDR